MKIVKKVIALISAAFIILRIVVIDCFAVSAAPVLIAEEVKAILSELLLSTGLYVASDLTDKSCADLQVELSNLVSSETFPTDSPDALNNLINTFMNMVTSPAATVTDKAVKAAFDAWWQDFVDDYDVLSDQYIIPTPNFDTNLYEGHGAVYRLYNDYHCQDIFCEYIVVLDALHVKLINCDYLKLDGEIKTRYGSCMCIEVSYPYPDVSHRNWSVAIYGDVQHLDGAEAPSDEEYLDVIGEVDGTAVTPDMLNPDGTYTKDGETYYPENFIDFTKFVPKALISIIKKLLEMLDNAAVVDGDNASVSDMVGDVSVELDIAELNNLVAPPVIADVFPFCLPWDFVRGLKLLSAKPVAPKFEIPFNIPEFGLFEGYEGSITLDMSKYSKYFEVARWVQVILFMIGLCFISFKVVKGVH